MSSTPAMTLAEIDTPALWVDLDTMERNIAELVQHFQSAHVGWRPHIKGIKIPAIARKAINAGALGVTCAKVSEAEVMVDGGIDSVLLANQIVTDIKIRRLATLQDRAEVMAVVDCVDAVHRMARIGRELRTPLPVLVDLNTGMNRTGIEPGGKAVNLARLVQGTPGLRLRGLMAYEGHAIEIEETEAKNREIRRAVNELVRTATMCRERGLRIDIVSGGGSGTYKVMPFQDGVTECQAGGAIFSDMAYPTWDVDTHPALFVRSTVTSRPFPHQVVFDAGWKALPAWARSPSPLGIDHVEAFVPSAEHGTVTLSRADESIRIGQAFDFVVGYNDSTVFLHDVLYGVRDGVVEEQWRIEGRGKLN